MSLSAACTSDPAATRLPPDSVIWLARATAAAYFVGVVASTVLVVSTSGQPIVEEHGFRQTQTALSVYWGVLDGWRLAYLTPVTGAPWSVPFEFPLFQWIVAAVWTGTGLSLDQAGRLTAFAFHLGCSWMVRGLLIQLACPRPAAGFGALAFLLAPVNVFWGRAFLIESCALFLALAYLRTTLVLAGIRDPAGWRLACLLGLATLLATAAALVKITTFVVPAALATGLGLSRIASDLRSEPILPASRSFRQALLVTLPVVFAFGAAWAWIAFSDAVKAQGLVSTALQSSNLKEWNIGTLAQRMSSQLWQHTIWDRAVPEAIGQIALAFAAVLTALWVRGPALALATAFVAAYLGTFLWFSNLHMVHNYYQYAAAVWLVCALAVVLGEVMGRSAVLFALAALLVLAQQLSTLGFGYAKLMTRAIVPAAEPLFIVAEAVRNALPPDGVFIMFGNDWSSDVAYYAERRAVMVPAWPGLPEQVLAGRAEVAHPYRAMLVVACGLDTASTLARSIDAIRTKPAWDVLGCRFTPVAAG